MERRKNLEKRASIDSAPRKHPLMKTKGVTQGRVGVDSIVGAGKETRQFGIFSASAQALGDALYQVACGDAIVAEDVKAAQARQREPLGNPFWRRRERGGAFVLPVGFMDKEDGDAINITVADLDSGATRHMGSTYGVEAAAIGVGWNKSEPGSANKNRRQAGLCLASTGRQVRRCSLCAGFNNARIGIGRLEAGGWRLGIGRWQAEYVSDSHEESTIQELSKKFLGILRAEVFRDFKGRLAGLIKALTTGFRLNNFISNVTLVLDHQISKFKDAGVWLDGNNLDQFTSARRRSACSAAGQRGFSVSVVFCYYMANYLCIRSCLGLFEDCCVGAAVMVGLLKRFEECCDGAAVMVGLLPVEATTNFGVM
ncbi:unnamed protein product, partial [Ilex paraguariensis]